jgi:hypothetical protein
MSVGGASIEGGNAMIELILTVCTLTASQTCSETRLQFVADETPAQCVMRAPPTIAAWSEQHPGLRVARWRCAYPGQDGKPI